MSQHIGIGSQKHVHAEVGRQQEASALKQSMTESRGRFAQELRNTSGKTWNDVAKATQSGDLPKAFPDASKLLGSDQAQNSV
jgi:hypothetical protein